MLPGVNPSKSLASQPELDALAVLVGSAKSIDTIGLPLTAPLPENSIVAKFVPSTQPPVGDGVVESVDGPSCVNTEAANGCVVALGAGIAVMFGYKAWRGFAFHRSSAS